MRVIPNEASAAADSRPLAAIKSQPEDWRVHEHLGRPLAGHGEHRYLYLEKRNLNTMAVAAELIKRYGVRPQDIGFAGLKDKHGITRQWFSITTPNDSIDEDLRSPVLGASGEYITCLHATRHTHKLRRGSHVRNDFVINLRGDIPRLVETVGQLAEPFANYFGPQRFGGNNLAAARRWLMERKPRRVTGSRRSLYLSVARSHLFNLILAERERQGLWQCCMPGDALDEPAGSLWGRGRSPFSDRALAIENAAVADEQALCHGLEMAGVSRGLRLLGVTPSNFSFAQPQGEAILEISFGLPPGAYATVMLQRNFELKDQSR
ncbi:MAG: tRNA pseudouridine(13) synthase TruD [Pseudomonadota bacterium]|nr:tRNA pseudouridine(13) synthase TruD [Pseudomonadota bacterium]